MFEKSDYIIGAVVGGGLATLMTGDLVMCAICIIATLVFVSFIPD